MRRYVIALAIVFCLVNGIFAEAEPEPEAASASSGFSSLIGVERKLVFEVGKYSAPDGKRWIRFFAEFESAYRAGMEDVIAALWDFESSPKTFSRIEATRVRSDTGTTAVIEQRTGVRVLGFAYLSNLVFRDELRRDGPNSATLEFEAIEVDDTTLSSRGSWTLIEGRDASGPVTYVRYILESCVKPKFPAQEFLMRRFGAGDMRRIIRELNKAAIRRIKGD